MSVKNTGVRRIPIQTIEMNALSANEEDGATFERLKTELGKHGMIDLPVVLDIQGKNIAFEYRCIAGHHRIKAWNALGNLEVDAVVLEGELTPEEEFNLVNNLNGIRGSTTLSSVKRVIRAQKLDVSQIDLFKFPATKLMPSVKLEATQNTAQRRAKIRDMSLKIAPKLAEVILDDMEAVVVALRHDDKLVLTIAVDASPAFYRRNVAIIKKVIGEAIEKYELEEGGK